MDIFDTSKNSKFVRLFEPEVKVPFSKSKLSSLFLTHSRIGAQYGREVFTGMKN